MDTLLLIRDPAIQSLLDQRTHRFVTCWEVVRTDAVTLRFTDHDMEIEVEGETFIPIGGFNASARRKEASLRAQNLEVVGVISSDAIKAEDLRAGRYREAAVTEMIVDWKYPWVGPILTNKYWIAEVTFSDEVWEARVEGLTRWFNPHVGQVYSKLCRYRLGDDQCGIDVTVPPYTVVANAVASVLTADRKIQVDTTLNGYSSGYFAYGQVTWTTGDNTGLYSEIKVFAEIAGPQRTVEFQLRTPFTIEVADEFSIQAGCDKLAGTCKDDFSNLVNFGGFPFIPGNDRMLQSPKSK